MHSRKSHKLHDGFFERHRNHPYQNNSKYKSAKRKYRSYDKCENGTTSDNDSSESDSSTSSTSSTSTSSSSNQDHYRRNSSHNSFNRNNNCFDDAVNDRYHSEVSYLQKMRDKERDYRDFKMPSASSSTSSFARDRDNRDRELQRDYRDRDRYSPKDRVSNKNRDHRTNHDRAMNDTDSSVNIKSNYVRDKKTHNSSSNDKESERDSNKLTKVGDWSEHISSSGKKYYFNCKTETSQWEKPREWIGRERERERNRERDKYNTTNENTNRTKDRDRFRERERSRSPFISNQDQNQNEKHSSFRITSSSNVTTTTVLLPSPTTSNINSWSDNSNSTQLARNTSLDMDISPLPVNNIPISETVCSQHVSPQSWNSASVPTTAEVTTSNNKPVQASTTIMITTSTPTSSSTPVTAIVTTPGPVLIANALPRLIINNQPGTVTVDSSPVSRLMVSMVNQSGSSNLNEKSIKSTIDTKTDAPTSNTGDTTTNLLIDSLDSSSPVANLPHDPRKLTSPTTSHAATTQNAVRSQGPILSSTLVNFYREDLTEHMRNVSVDDCDKEIEKYSEEASSLTNTLLRTSADLKKARSLVRCDEIKSTLQEQRILFLAQRIKTLEELKLRATILSDDK